MDEKFKDLLDDEELTSLRLQALATKKRKLENVDQNSSDSVPALPINSIVSTESSSNQIPFVKSDRNTYNNYTRRKHGHSLRRRGGPFPKGNQRSNLIVISPVALNEGKDSEERFPGLILPQHKWCNSGNEDSMSPKTLRRTGPTRFNRHGSDSESSDSDFENSENDSGSNETVLQDEPPEHFPHLSPKSDAVPDSGEKQRRLSFQNLETEIQSDDFEKSETTSVYNCLKNSLSLDHAKDQSDNFVQNVSENMHSVSNEFNNYKHYNNSHSYSTKPVETSEGFVERQNSIKNNESLNETDSLFAQASDAFVRKCTGVKSNNSYYSSDTSAISDNTANHRFNDRKSKDFSDKRQSLQMSCEIQSSDSFVRQQREKSNMYFSKDSYNRTASRNYNETNLNSKEKSLSGDDLRLELKKRMQEMQSRPSVLENCNDLVDTKNSEHFNSWDRSKRRHTYEEDRISEVHSTNLFGNRQNLNSNVECNRQDLSYSTERYKNDNNANFIKRGNRRSISQDRNKQESFFNEDKNKSEFTFGSERNTYDSNSDLYGKNNEIISKQGTSRLECSSSRDQARQERSSSRGRSRYERSSSQDRGLEHSSSKNKVNFPRSAHKENKQELSSTIKDKNKHEYRSSQEGDKHEHSVGYNKGHREKNVSDDKSKQSQSRYKHRYSSRKRRYARDRSQDRDKRERRSSRNSSSDSSSQNSRSGFSSSSDSRSESSSSRDKSKSKYSSSPERNRQKRSQSHDRGRYKRSQSQDKGRYRKSSSTERNKDNRHSYKRRSHERSRSKDGKLEHSPIQNRTRNRRSFSPDRNKHESNSTQDKNTDELNETKIKHDYGLNATKNSYKGSSNQSKQQFSVVSSNDKTRHEQIPIHEYSKSCNEFQNKKPESFQDAEKFNDDKTLGRTNKEQSVTGKENSQTYTKNTEKNKESKEHQKFDKISNTNYKSRYSRSRSGSTSSYSSTSSSSSSQNLRPKIRSVPSVIKSVQPKSLLDSRTETFCEVKLSGKNNFSIFQSDIGSTSYRKDAVDFNKFSSIKGGRVDVDSKVSDSNKRVPVHMRLGVLPRKRLIQMPKDVEAAFVNSSSSSESENVNTKCKRQNIRIVTDIYGNKSKIDFEKKQLGKEKGLKQSPELYQEKSKHTKTHR